MFDPTLKRSLNKLVNLPEWLDIKTEVLPRSGLVRRERKEVLHAMDNIEKFMGRLPSMRVRKGLQQVIFAANCEFDIRSNDHTFSKRELENFQLAIDWLREMAQ